MNYRILLTLAVSSAPAFAQAPRVDTLRLSALLKAAEQVDPRSRELALLNAQSRLRTLNLNAERRPSLAIESQAQYQSDVVALPGGGLPPGLGIPRIAHDTYDAHLSAQQRLFDAT